MVNGEKASKSRCDLELDRTIFNFSCFLGNFNAGLNTDRLQTLKMCAVAHDCLQIQNQV